MASFDNTLASLGITRTGATSGTSAASAGSEVLGQKDFLALMTAAALR